MSQSSASEWRDLTDWEQSIMEILLGSEFPGRDQLMAQLQNCRVRTESEYEDSYGSIEFAIDPSTPRAHVTGRIPVEAQGEDSDGTQVSILLHVEDGRLRELEVYKPDGTQLQRRPSPEGVTPWVKD